MKSKILAWSVIRLAPEKEAQHRGSFIVDGFDLRAACRNHFFPEIRLPDLGFRVVCDLGEL